MSKTLKTVFLFFVVTIISCSKNDGSIFNNSGSIIGSPLHSGEFYFDSLSWKFNNSGSGEIYLVTPARADLFFSTSWLIINAEILLKFDTANNWVEFNPYTWNSANNYYYEISPYSLVIST